MKQFSSYTINYALVSGEEIGVSRFLAAPPVTFG